MQKKINRNTAPVLNYVHFIEHVRAASLSLCLSVSVSVYVCELNLNIASIVPAMHLEIISKKFMFVVLEIE